MHSDPAKSRRASARYMMIGAALLVFTVITVAANLVHLAVPLAITLALIIATIKGSMVAAVFMHLNHEKQWIYGSLVLTVVVLHRADVRAAVHDDGHDRHAHPRAGAPRMAARRGARGH